MNKNHLIKVWEEIVRRGLMSEKNVQEHIARADKIDWKFTPKIRCDIEGTLKIRNWQTGRSELNQSVHECLKLLQEHDREIELISSSVRRGLHTELTRIGVNEEFLPVKRRDTESLVQEDFNRSVEHDASLPPLEAVFDDNVPYINSHVSHINPYDLIMPSGS